MPTSARESVETLTIFDTKKWKRMINGNVEMIQKKVDQSTPHHVLFRELDDLKMIVSNCMDQLSKSLGRQIELAKNEAVQFHKVALQDLGSASFANKQRGLNKDESALTLMLSPKSVANVDLGNIEVLNKI